MIKSGIAWTAKILSSFGISIDAFLKFTTSTSANRECRSMTTKKTLLGKGAKKSMCRVVRGRFGMLVVVMGSGRFGRPTASHGIYRSIALLPDYLFEENVVFF